ncbi:MAG: hypothetical protein COB93_10280, partial [Sneathiella sp.]
TAQWLDHGPGTKRPHSATFDRHAAMDILGDQHRENIGQIWKARRKILGPHFREFGSSRRQLAVLLSAETLDQAAIDAAYMDMIAKRIEIEGLLKISLLEFAKSLPPDQRAAFFKEGFHTQKRHKRPGKEKRD